MIYIYNYIQQITGGIGLIGLPRISGITDLYGIIQSSVPNFETIGGFIFGIEDNIHTHTSGGGFVYLQYPEAGFGIIGIIPTPDLYGAISVGPDIFSDINNLQGIIRAKREGTTDLVGYIRPAASGELELSGTLYGYMAHNLIGYIRGTISSGSNLEGFIEPIPPVGLSGTLCSYYPLDLEGNIESIEPTDLIGQISALQKMDLYGNITGADSEDLLAELNGYATNALYGIILAERSGTLELSGTLRGMLGQGISENFYGYITPVHSGNGSIIGQISGVLMKELQGTIFPYVIGEDLQGNIGGEMPGSLSGSITPTGALNGLSGYILVAHSDGLSLTGSIDGTALDDLMGTIYTEDGYLIGNIEGERRDPALLSGVVLGISINELFGEYIAHQADLLKGQIESIDSVSLSGIITPRVFYIESSLPINTYPFEELRASINGDICDYSSYFSDLRAIIKGIYPCDLSASLIGHQGQYVLTSDEIEIFAKNSVDVADWIFTIIKQPTFAEDGITLILTSSPLGDLGGYIEGIHYNADLSGSITPRYVSPVARKDIEIGEWVNTRTGDRKLVKIKFRGAAQNFYYSSEGNTTYPLNSLDNLEIIVETYKIEGSSDNSLLATKQNVRQHKINKLEDFDSIDSAIKYAIMCAAGELNGELTGYIKAVGKIEEIQGDISGLDSRFLRDLKGSVVAVGQDPILHGSISGSGGIKDLTSYVESTYPSITSSIFTDSYGIRYKPTLVVHSNGDYSVTLTIVPSGVIIDDNSPDLTASIEASIFEEVEASISGSV